MEIMTTGEHEFKEMVEEYEEEILMHEEVPEPPLTDSADTASAQGKPRCITLILIIIMYIYYIYIYIYICCVFTLQEFYGNYMHIYNYPKSLTSAGSSSCYA
jgi:hypothetical protein